MNNKSIPSVSTVTALVLALTLVLPWGVFADAVVNKLDTTPDPAFESATILAGEAVTINFYLDAVTKSDAPGCNATGNEPAYLTLTPPDGVAASWAGYPAPLQFIGCGVDNVRAITFSSSVPATYSIEASAFAMAGGKAGSVWDLTTAQFTLIVEEPPATNNPPVAGFSWLPLTPDEGQAVQFTDESTDSDGTIAVWSWDLDGDGAADSAAQHPAHTFLDNGVYHACLTVSDDDGSTATACHDVTVLNVPPTITCLSAPVDPVNIADTVGVTVCFTDPGLLDTHTASIFWGDGTDTTVAATTSGGSGSASGSHTYAQAGVYRVSVTVTDKDGGSDSAFYEYVVVYDPSAGFVTGGGWIVSPAGAYAADAALTGKATFGFVSKYQKGAKVPTGQTEFQFHAAGLDFHSTAYEWLVIAGNKAMYKGTGVINGQGQYGFLLSALDGDAKKGVCDQFRIKIWDLGAGRVIYDNQMGAADDALPATGLGGGSIVVHSGK